MVRTLGILALKPRTSLIDGRLLIESNLYLQRFTLGFLRTSIVVDPVAREFTFRKKGKLTRVILFEEVERLDYSYADTGINTDSELFGSLDTIEWFTISLILRETQEQVTLVRIVGEGSVDHGMLGALLGDGGVDYRGDQEEASQGLVRLLKAMTGLSLV
ncbi:hypothetical protein JIN85_03655 [Luteolibacter pohnpeiensis]|uniref:Uncharacterized protein n=1 Tax=Luteolibacter pohnpeiensis TaxID=454153 RepID=A0A934VPX3_9BACT|nr:hypothetical protein [Luteolibacter pohnpeiensis]MBK1881496.1 hypothetical protein [Luteolibacter pohnpeiensis]